MFWFVTQASEPRKSLALAIGPLRKQGSGATRGVGFSRKIHAGDKRMTILIDSAKLSLMPCL